ncbi:Short-chain dehydrogenase reductase 3a [Lachnellula suecica]|uniref:Short-chain dehydrogenase reductase 3a n=1 Tax=Lachnellula suecica TaxID=602035 RepID=A0A8T9BZD7_9HELO|nr:Short-chain dehydrogenase reductase 3a [Lachnellula suecica]
MAFPDFPLAHKIAVITGAGSGINLAFARLCIQHNAKVLIADLKLTSEASTFLSTLDSKTAVFVKCDVAKRCDLENLVTVSEKEWGDVPDVWVAGAGVFEPSWSNFWDDTEEDDYAQVAINVNHPIKLARIAIRALLRKGKKGVFLITASIAGFAGNFSAPLYCATKHAIVGFVRSMKDFDEVGGVKFVAIAPGYVFTPPPSSPCQHFLADAGSRVVRTPLWTDYPEKMKQFGYMLENSITPEKVSQDMAELVTEGKYGGGTCLETSATGTRVLGTWNIEPPSWAGKVLPKEVLDNFRAPIMEHVRRERAGGDKKEI